MEVVFHRIVWSVSVLNIFLEIKLLNPFALIFYKGSKTISTIANGSSLVTVLTVSFIGRVEKYRPAKTADIVGNHELISRIRAIAQQGNMPNLLLCVRYIYYCHYDLFAYLGTTWNRKDYEYSLLS